MPGVDLRVVEVRSDVWREFWLISKEAGGTYSLDVYATEEDAIAETHRLSFATHVASSGGNSIDVTMTVDPAAAFDCTPMVVTLHAQGSWASARIAWTHNLTGILIRRIAELLELYTADFEMLGRAGNRTAFEVQIGHQTPMALTPAVGVSSGAVTLEDQVQQFEGHSIQVELHAWVARLENEDAYSDAVRAGSALLAIVEEQRTWGGIAGDSKVQNPGQIGIELREGGGLTYHALVVFSARFPDLTATRGPGSNEYGTGGVYAAALP